MRCNIIYSIAAFLEFFFYIAQKTAKQKIKIKNCSPINYCPFFAVCFVVVKWKCSAIGGMLEVLLCCCCCCCCTMAACFVCCVPVFKIYCIFIHMGMIVIQNDTLISHSLSYTRYVCYLFLSLTPFLCFVYGCVFIYYYYLNIYLFLRTITHATKAYILDEAISDELLRVIFLFIITFFFFFPIQHFASFVRAQHNNRNWNLFMLLFLLLFPKRIGIYIFFCYAFSVCCETWINIHDNAHKQEFYCYGKWNAL